MNRENIVKCSDDINETEINAFFIHSEGIAGLGEIMFVSEEEKSLLLT